MISKCTTGCPMTTPSGTDRHLTGSHAPFYLVGATPARTARGKSRSTTRLTRAGPGHHHRMDHSSAPILDALVAYRERGDINFTPPGHKQGRGVDERVTAVLGTEPFAADVMMMNGLDDRSQTHGVLEQAQQLMADAVG